MDEPLDGAVGRTVPRMVYQRRNPSRRDTVDRKSTTTSGTRLRDCLAPRFRTDGSQSRAGRPDQPGRSVKALRRILRSDVAVAIACFVGAFYIRVVRYTGLWRIEGEHIPESFRISGRPFILAFWHGRLLMMPYCWRHTDLVNMLISGHQDGRLISQTVRHFAIESVVGSTTRGGAQATRRLIRLMRDGGIVGITPDGPRGPRMRVGEGTVALARLSGAPIIPATFSASRRRVMKSWDRFVVALPFARGVFLWGKPIEVPRDANGETLEASRRALEDAMNELAGRADALMGQEVIEPGPPQPADRPVEAGIGD